MSRSIARPVAVLVGVLAVVLAGPSAAAWAASEDPGMSNPLVSTTPASAPTSMAAVQAEVNHQLGRTKGGSQVASNVVSYDNGKVRVVFPLPGSDNLARDAVGPSPVTGGNQTGVAPDALFYDHGCPYGYFTKWSCFYQDANFGGTKLEFKDCDYEQYLSNYGFGDKTSSWVNTKNYATVVVRDQWGNYLWTEGSAQHTGYVGSANNDRAWEFYIHSNGNCQN